MSFTQAFFLGLLQGIGEFLPISSSGHLFIAKHYLGISEIPTLFDIALHIATLAAVFCVLHQKISTLASVGLRWVMRKTTHKDAQILPLLKTILLATAVTVVLALLLESIEVRVTGVAIGFVYTSLLLIAMRMLPSHPTWQWAISACVLGVFQGIATLPGVSRSGSTIFAAQLAGYSKQDSAELSFILSIPIIIAALLYSLKDIAHMSAQVPIGPFLMAMIVAFLAGLIALKFLIKLISKAQLFVFAYYLIPLATFVLIKQ